jgi:hypothetical protein
MDDIARENKEAQRKNQGLDELYDYFSDRFATWAPQSEEVICRILSWNVAWRDDLREYVDRQKRADLNFESLKEGDKQAWTSFLGRLTPEYFEKFHLISPFKDKVMFRVEENGILQGPTIVLLTPDLISNLKEGLRDLEPRSGHALVAVPLQAADGQIFRFDPYD